MAETEDYDKSATPTAHKTTHQDGGSDEISVEGLAGELTAEQKSAWSKVSGKPTTFTPAAHKTTHQDGGSDEISVAGLDGELTAEQKSAWSKVSGKPTTFTPEAHHTTHEAGGTDIISVAGLVGLFDIDIDGNLEPITADTIDQYYEVDSNSDIMPKAA